ncbi:hypothetical protein D5018_12640 [Parashewanella curva]|uniref:Uncharacterized protein n=1 Tax=Parashewanella curva TaxID=2338552 RepID=A0A3L8PVH7_9GAMM|nr:hypothetical protein [Parashewanella curva]RLV59336.1 hypothetical protein D5018_12640 [Parashewanella curva]
MASVKPEIPLKTESSCSWRWLSKYEFDESESWAEIEIITPGEGYKSKILEVRKTTNSGSNSPNAAFFETTQAPEVSTNFKQEELLPHKALDEQAAPPKVLPQETLCKIPNANGSGPIIPSSSIGEFDMADDIIQLDEVENKANKTIHRTIQVKNEDGKMVNEMCSITSADAQQNESYSRTLVAGRTSEHADEFRQKVKATGTLETSLALEAFEHYLTGLEHAIEYIGPTFPSHHGSNELDESYLKGVPESKFTEYLDFMRNEHFPHCQQPFLMQVVGIKKDWAPDHAILVVYSKDGAIIIDSKDNIYPSTETYPTMTIQFKSYNDGSILSWLLDYNNCVRYAIGTGLLIAHELRCTNPNNRIEETKNKRGMEQLIRSLEPFKAPPSACFAYRKENSSQ